MMIMKVITMVLKLRTDIDDENDIDMSGEWICDEMEVGEDDDNNDEYDDEVV